MALNLRKVYLGFNDSINWLITYTGIDSVNGSRFYTLKNVFDNEYLSCNQTFAFDNANTYIYTTPIDDSLVLSDFRNLWTIDSDASGNFLIANAQTSQSLMASDQLDSGYNYPFLTISSNINYNRLLWKISSYK